MRNYERNDDGLIEIVALVNWENEQLEVTKWVSVKDVKNLQKEMQSIVNKIFVRFIKNRSFENLDKAQIAIAETDAKANKREIIKNVHFVFAKGYYLDKEKLSYFIPTKILVEDDVPIDDL